MKTGSKESKLLRAALVVALVVSLLFVAASAAEARHLLGEERHPDFDTGATVYPVGDLVNSSGPSETLEVSPGDRITISCCENRISGHESREFDVGNVPDEWALVQVVDESPFEDTKEYEEVNPADVGGIDGGTDDFDVWGQRQITFRIPENAIPGRYEIGVTAQGGGDSTLASDSLTVAVRTPSGGETGADGAELPENVTTFGELFGDADGIPDEGAGPDFGDADDPPYPTKEESDGARHEDISRAWLGEGVDAEEEADLPFDEFDDGLVSIGDKLRVNVTNDDHDGTLYLNALLDLNESDSWDSPEEWIVENEPVTVPPGESKVVAVDADIPPMRAGMIDRRDMPPLRITLSGEEVSSYDGTGEFAIGETEDYLTSEKNRTRPDQVGCRAFGYHGGWAVLAGGPAAGAVFNLTIAKNTNITEFRTSSSKWIPAVALAFSRGRIVKPKPLHETWMGNLDIITKTFHFKTADGRVLKAKCGAAVQHPFPRPTIETGEGDPRGDPPGGEEGGIETRSSLQPAWYYAGGQTIGGEYNPAMEDDADLPGWVKGLVDYARMAASVKTEGDRVRVGAELDDQHKVVGMKPMNESEMGSFDPQATVKTSGRTVESILRSPDRVAAVRSAIEHGEINVKTKSTLRGIQYGATTAVSRIGTKVRGSKYDCGPNEVRQIEYAGEEATLSRSAMGYRIIGRSSGGAGDGGEALSDMHLNKVHGSVITGVDMHLNKVHVITSVDDKGAPQGVTTEGTQRLIEEGGTSEFSRRSVGVYSTQGTRRGHRGGGVRASADPIAESELVD